jgi:uncharacterized protein
MGYATAAYVVVCVFGAAFVRGYSGFGFSLLAITSLSLLLPPAEIIPPIFMMEVLASVSLLPGIWKDIHWRALGLLSLGCLIATPIGVWLLVAIPTAPMKIGLSIVVLVAVVILARGYARQTMPNRVETVATGAVSGLLNGALGIGGPPVIIFFFNSPAGAAMSRASLIAYFIGTDTIGLGFLASEGLVTLNAFYALLLMTPALLIGQWVGARSFAGSEPEAFRRWVFRLLAVLAVLTGLQGVLAVLGAS